MYRARSRFISTMSNLPAIVTPALLTSIRNHPELPKNAWHIVSSVTLNALNRPDEIPKIYIHALETATVSENSENDHEEKLQISRRMREALLKASAVGGVPKTINALLHLKEATPEDLQDPQGTSPTSRRSHIYSSPPSEILTRGQSFFDKLYGKVSKRVMGQMDRSGTEDLGLIARLVYGYILSNESVLTAAETSFCMIAGLIPQDVSRWDWDFIVAY